MQLERIYFVRHGESEANVSLKAYSKYPDHKVPLTKLGKDQALDTGYFLNNHFTERSKNEGAMPKIRLWNSPYHRTRQTAEGILISCNDIVHSSQEENMLVEMQFGLFDGIDDANYAKLFPIEYKMYKHAKQQKGKYWARLPHGESPFDVDIRTKHLQGTFSRDAEKHGIKNIIIASHGITSRVMSMRYLHQTPEEYHDDKNPKNGSVRLLQKENGIWQDRGYIFTP